MYLKRRKYPVHEMRQMDNMIADVERQKALTGYVAMMADVEIPSEEEVNDYAE